MTLRSVIEQLQAARRSADSVLASERDGWKDEQYERFVERHYRPMISEVDEFLSVLGERDRGIAALQRSLEASR